MGRTNLTEVYLVGVGDALSAHSAAEAKGIKAHFRMDESGLLLLDNVESLFEYPPEEEEQSTLSSEALQDPLYYSILYRQLCLIMHVCQGTCTLLFRTP